jgi:dTDP-4-dehydrorhamnose 3,5-epimerase
MHYQLAPHAEIKLVRCLKGSVWDVGVDLRAESPTFLHWYAVELTPENGKMIVIPEGCAHGYQVLEQDSELLYLHTASYCPSAEGGVRHDDPSVGIDWPLPVGGLSERDLRHPFISEDFKGLVL